MILDFIIDFIFPKFCLFCDVKGENLCSKCKKTRFEYYNGQFCHVCKRSINKGFVHEKCKFKTELKGVFIVIHYNLSAKNYLKQVKYNLYFSMSKEIGLMLREKLDFIHMKFEFITPVPLFKKKYWKRGFNQAELLAKEINPNLFHCIKRKRNTKTQVGLSKKDRQVNLKYAFEVTKDVRNKTILLVDDVMTSGTTLEECAKVLKSNNAKEVYALVWARD